MARRHIARDNSSCTDDSVISNDDPFEHNGPGTNEDMLTYLDGFHGDDSINAGKWERMRVMIHDESTTADHGALANADLLASAERAAGEPDIITDVNDSRRSEQRKNDRLAQSDFIEPRAAQGDDAAAEIKSGPLFAYNDRQAIKPLTTTPDTSRA